MNPVYRNIAILMGAQGIGFVIPLVTTPFLARVMGPISYGQLGFALAFIQYFVVLADYGFNLSAAQKIAVAKENKTVISHVFCTVMCCKAVLGLFGFSILFLAICISPELAKNRWILVTAYTAVIGNVLFPAWFFQGLEQMARLALLNGATKVLSVPLFLLFVKGPQDIVVAVLVSCLPNCFAAIAGIYYIFKESLVQLHSPSLIDLRNEFKSGWDVFISTVSVSLYTSTITVVLGLMAGPISVAYYIAADRLRQAITGLISPVSQAIYPRVSVLMIENRIAAYAFLRKLLCVQVGLVAFASALLCISASTIVEMLYGSGYDRSGAVLRWLAWAPTAVAISNVIGVQTFLPLGMSKAFSRVLISSGLITILVLFPTVYVFKEVGAAASALFAEVSVAVFMIQIVLRGRIPVLPFMKNK